MTIEEYASVRATPELVGRKDILQEIYDAINEKTEMPHVFYITAPGGWGKTRLLDAVLKSGRADIRIDKSASKKFLFASRLVDLYHTYTHSEEGLVADIVEVLSHQGDHFNNYAHQHAELDRVKYDLSQILRSVIQQRANMMDAFINDFNHLGDNYKKIVLAFDTVENLVYETDRVQNALGLADEPIGVAGWLIKEFFVKIHNAVILVAGRPESPQLQVELEKLATNKGIKFSHINLGTFTEVETLAYFNAVVDVARNENQQIADRLEKIPQDTRLVLHYLSGGEPFLLSLFVDYLTVAERLLPIIRTPLKEIIDLASSEEGLQKEREKFKDAILEQFQSVQRPFDEVIRVLSWTQKGMGATLLAWILKRDRPTEEDVEEAKQIIQTLRDPQFRLSFVKIRDIDNLVFLQDEMYNLMLSLHQRGRVKHHIKQTYELITRFYEERIRDQARIVEYLQKETSQLISSGSWKEFTEAKKKQLFTEQQKLRDARVRLQSFQVDYVYYCFQVDYIKGIQSYYRAAETAFQSNDLNLWLLLRDELLKFAKPLRLHENELEALKYIDGDIGVRWIKTNIANGQYEKALLQIEQFRSSCPDLLEHGSFAELSLRIWEVWALTYSGREYDRAKNILMDVFVSIDDLTDKFEPEFDEWRRKLLIAYAQEIAGYLYRSQGDFLKAAEYYRKNLHFWRELSLESEHANTLSNLSWVLAELGDFQSAIRYCEDGLNLRRKLGHRYPIALSLNTLGLIEIRNGQPERARFRCEQALGIFRDLEQPRGIGLASIALSEALRMMTGVSDLLTDEQSMMNLELAEQYAVEAVEIFTHTVKERLRLVEIYIELGCIYREMARRKKTDQPILISLVTKSANAFESAVRNAEVEFAHLAIDAFVNEAWMYYYVDDFENTQKVLDQALQMVDTRYFFTKEKMQQRDDEFIPWFWVQLGKAYLLLGKMTFDKYEQENGQGNWKEAEMLLRRTAQYWTLSLAYNERYGKSFRDNLTGRKEIYNCLGILNVKEISWVKAGILDAYREYDDVAGLRTFESFVDEQF